MCWKENGAVCETCRVDGRINRGVESEEYSIKLEQINKWKRFFIANNISKNIFSTR